MTTKKAQPMMADHYVEEIIGQWKHKLKPPRWCFVAVALQNTLMSHQHLRGKYGLAIAVEKEPGYHSLGSVRFMADNFEEAATEAERLNSEALQMNVETAWEIIVSTMRPA